MAKKKIRKPGPLKLRNGHTVASVGDMGLWHQDLTHFDLAFLKKMHKWLGQAIEYLEAR